MSQDRLPSNEEIYAYLNKIIAEAQNRLKAGGVEHSRIILWMAGYGELQFEIIEGKYFGGSEERVKGKALWACVDELIRRKGFQENQKLLALGPPTIEG